MEPSEVLAEGVPKVDSRMVLSAEADRFQRFETELLGSLIITPLWYLDPLRRLRREGFGRGRKQDRLCRLKLENFGGRG